MRDTGCASRRHVRASEECDAAIEGLNSVPSDALVFHAGTRRDDGGRILTAGGRVLTVVGLGADLATARERAYVAADAISFAGRHLRRDVALREITDSA